MSNYDVINAKLGQKRPEFVHYKPIIEKPIIEPITEKSITNVPDFSWL